MQKVIVFGHGRYYKSKKENLKKMYQVSAFIDNVVQEGEVQYDDGIPIYNPKDLEKISNVSIVIMSAKFYDMSQELIELGVDERRILFGVMILPFWDNVEQAFYDLKYNIIIENKKFVIKSINDNFIMENKKVYEKFVRQLFEKRDPFINLIANMQLNPISRRWGLERGTAIDRYYIENFLKSYKDYIFGNVMEIADNTYTNMFGDHIIRAYALHVKGWGENSIKGNLETGEGIVENTVDCLICTQTIQFIFNLKEVVKNIYKVLKPGGVALVTAHGIAQLSLYDYHLWGEFWRFTEKSMNDLFTQYFADTNVKVYSFGNVKTTIAFLYGLCAEDLQTTDFAYNDEQFPLVLAAAVVK